MASEDKPPTPPRAPLTPEQKAARFLLAFVVFGPLAVGVYPGDMGMLFIRLLAVGAAFLFLRMCPDFEEELVVDPKGRAWQTLVGVVIGAAVGVGRALGAAYTPWTGTAIYTALVKSLDNVRAGPHIALIELLPLLVVAGVVEAILYAGMLRWVVTRPRGPLPFWAAVPLVALAYAWLHFCVPRLPESPMRLTEDWLMAAPYAAVAFGNAIVAAIATRLTRSPLLAGAFLGVQWWVCLAMMYVGLA